MTSFCSPLRFINRTRQNSEIPRSVWKQTEAHRSVSAVKPIIWKRSWVRSECGFGDMKGVLDIIEENENMGWANNSKKGQKVRSLLEIFRVLATMAREYIEAFYQTSSFFRVWQLALSQAWIYFQYEINYTPKYSLASSVHSKFLFNILNSSIMGFNGLQGS